MPRKPINKPCVQCGNEFTTKYPNQECCCRGCSNKLKAIRYKEKCIDEGVTQVWACGGGVESTAIAALIILGVLPKPTYSYFVNCGFEKERTLKHVRGLLIPELKKVDIILNILNPTSNKIINKGRSCVPAFFKMDNGKESRLPQRCGHWKQPHAKRWLRERGVKRCDCWVGISIDESNRQRQSFKWWYQNKYPLIELGISRSDCEDVIARIGWPPAPRTSCYICPNQKNIEWIDLKENWPNDFKRAIAVEKQLHELDTNIFLHRRCIPLEEIEFNSEGQKGNINIDKWFNGNRVGAIEIDRD